MRFVGKVYRPPSEARSLLLQATIGCSWNKCTYCDMYVDKPVFRLRPLDEALEDLDGAKREYGNAVQKLFVTDGDALCMPMENWLPILTRAKENFPNLRQVSCYAMARNILEKTDEELATLRENGLNLMYIGPESGDEITLKRIAKGSSYDDHVAAAKKLKRANIRMSVIFLLGAGGVERSKEHAKASGDLCTAMDPEYAAALTLTIVPGTPISRLAERGKFEVPKKMDLLEELYAFIDNCHTTKTLFRTNHASNYLPLGGTLPQDKPMMLAALDSALDGDIPLRPEWTRGL